MNSRCNTLNFSLVGIVFFMTISVSYSQELGDFYSKSKYDTLLLKANDLPRLLKDVKTNRTLQYERLAAYCFHRIINQYRVSKKLKPLTWDDRLWLAARNHNIYLEYGNNHHINHHEIKNRPFFTGVTFQNRIYYVCNDSNVSNSGGGENIYWEPLNLKILDLKDIEYLAINIAEKSFNGWKSSSGHNFNMLRENNKSHGTSFYIIGKGSNIWRAYGTTVFSGDSLRRKPIVIDWSVSLAKKYANYKGKK